MSKLVFYYSSMNSGKSLTALTKNYMLTQRGFKTILMKPAIDTRTNNSISTRLGIEQACEVIGENQLPSETVMRAGQVKPDYVLVDEAQFFSKTQILDLANLVDNWNIDVICYGLRLDWQGNFFTGSETLFKLADELLAIENYCEYYKGLPAYFHIKKGGNGDSVEIGEENIYESVSRKKWLEWWSERNEP